MLLNEKSKNRLKVAIFGRPNVGKSTLFNQLTGTRKAIVKDQPGVTRDVHRGFAEWLGVKFEIFDTAGVTEGGDKAWSDGIRVKALAAAESADKIIFILDGKYGLNPEDKDLAKFVLRLKKPVFVAVNKLDQVSDHDLGLSEFYGLGFDSLQPTSFEHKFGIEEICDWVIEGEEIQIETEENKEVRIAVVGKPNAGKSTLVNSILGEDRVVVSPVAGTTIDSIEIPFSKNGKDYILVDTAGLKRHAQRADHVEMISAVKAEQSVQEADLLLLMIDGLAGPTHQDARIVEMVLEHHRGVILVVNKIDLAEKKIPRFREQVREKVAATFHFYSDIPLVYISAKTGRGADHLFATVEKVWAQLNFKISTREINEFFFNVIRQAPMPSYRGNDIKFYYITQTRQRPPSFMCFVNEPQGVTKSYRRFLATKIKEQFDLGGIPIRIYPKKRRRGETKARDVKYGKIQDEINP